MPVIAGMYMLGSNLSGQNLVDDVKKYLGAGKEKAVRVVDTVKNRMPDSFDKIGYEIIGGKGNVVGEFVNASETAKLKVYINPDLGDGIKINGAQYETSIMKGKDSSIDLTLERMNGLNSVGVKADYKMTTFDVMPNVGVKYSKKGFFGNMGVSKNLDDKLTIEAGNDLVFEGKKLETNKYLKGSYIMNKNSRIDFGMGGSKYNNRPSFGFSYSTGRR